MCEARGGQPVALKKCSNADTIRDANGLAEDLRS
jgi:hypothetical protein